MNISQKMGFTLMARWRRGLEAKRPCGCIIVQYLEENPHIDQRSRLKDILVAAKAFTTLSLRRHTGDPLLTAAHRSFSSALDCFIVRMEQD